MNKTINVSIIGVAGYGGTELIKLLLFHPRANLDFVTSRKYVGIMVSSVNRFLSGDFRLDNPQDRLLFGPGKLS